MKRDVGADVFEAKFTAAFGDDGRGADFAIGKLRVHVKIAAHLDQFRTERFGGLIDLFDGGGGEGGYARQEKSREMRKFHASFMVRNVERIRNEISGVYFYLRGWRVFRMVKCL